MSNLFIQGNEVFQWFPAQDRQYEMVSRTDTYRFDNNRGQDCFVVTFDISQQFSKDLTPFYISLSEDVEVDHQLKNLFPLIDKLSSTKPPVPIFQTGITPAPLTSSFLPETSPKQDTTVISKPLSSYFGIFAPSSPTLMPPALPTNPASVLSRVSSNKVLEELNSCTLDILNMHMVPTQTDDLVKLINLIKSKMTFYSIVSTSDVLIFKTLIQCLNRLSILLSNCNSDKHKGGYIINLKTGKARMFIQTNDVFLNLDVGIPKVLPQETLDFIKKIA